VLLLLLLLLHAATCLQLCGIQHTLLHHHALLLWCLTSRLLHVVQHEWPGLDLLVYSCADQALLLLLLRLRGGCGCTTAAGPPGLHEDTTLSAATTPTHSITPSSSRSPCCIADVCRVGPGSWVPWWVLTICCLALCCCGPELPAGPLEACEVLLLLLQRTCLLVTVVALQVRPGWVVCSIIITTTTTTVTTSSGSKPQR
jgi:hypothetical protein